MDIKKLSALDIGRMIKRKEITVSEVLIEQFRLIKENEDIYNCYITITEDEAFKQAEIVQKRIDKGKLDNQPLAGVPIAIKDNICTKGIRTTAASKILEDFIPPYEATVIEKLNQAGLIVIGKTNMDEFAMGSTTETSYFGATKNPVNIEHVPGGSSGGSAAAVAGYEAMLALGSDTGGSIRQPSSYCGITGLKPTYGRVSRYGLIAYASSLDQIGPIARNVSDMAALFSCIEGYDAKDSTSAGAVKAMPKHLSDDSLAAQSTNKNLNIIPFNIEKALVKDVKGLRIGIPRNYFTDGLDSEVRDAVLKATEVLRDNGALLEEFDLEGLKYAIPAYYVLAPAEASSNLSRYDGVKYGFRTKDYESLSDMYKKTRSEGFGSEAKRRMMLGAFVLSSGYYDAFYNKALKVKAIIKENFDKAFSKYDVIISPTTPSTAPKLSIDDNDPLSRYLGDIYTVSVNLAGLPALSVPCGKSESGFPIGIQMIGRAFEEEVIIRAAYTYEQSVKLNEKISHKNDLYNQQ